MKNLFMVIAIAAIFSLNACNHTCEKVPEKVKTAFSEKFPDAQKVNWEQEEENEWEAEFKMDDKEYSANFTSDGIWKETEYEIEKSDLPKVVMTTLETEFAGYNIDEVEISEIPEGKFYEVEIVNDDDEIEVTLTPDGRIVEKEIKKEEEHHDNDEGEHHDNDDD